MNKKTFSCLAITSFLTVSALQAQRQSAVLSDYQAKEFISSSGLVLPYRILYPENFDTSKQYPLVLFLHGAGERGNDNNTQLKHGGAMFTNPVNRTKYPCMAIFPQCPQEIWWAGGINAPAETEAGKDADIVVPADGSRQAFNILKEAGGEVEYIEYPGVEHNSWDYAFREKDFLFWLFSQSK